MPHVIVKLYPGRSAEQKEKLTQEIANALIGALGCSDESISIGIEEVAREDWTQAVYKPDIEGKAETLSKKPGYQPG